MPIAKLMRNMTDIDRGILFYLPMIRIFRNLLTDVMGPLSEKIVISAQIVSWPSDLQMLSTVDFGKQFPVVSPSLATSFSNITRCRFPPVGSAVSLSAKGFAFGFLGFPTTTIPGWQDRLCFSPAPRSRR